MTNTNGITARIVCGICAGALAALVFCTMSLGVPDSDHTAQNVILFASLPFGALVAWMVAK